MANTHKYLWFFLDCRTPCIRTTKHYTTMWNSSYLWSSSIFEEPTKTLDLQNLFLKCLVKFVWMELIFCHSLISLGVWYGFGDNIRLFRSAAWMRVSLTWPIFEPSYHRDTQAILTLFLPTGGDYAIWIYWNPLQWSFIESYRRITIACLPGQNVHLHIHSE